MIARGKNSEEAMSVVRLEHRRQVKSKQKSRLYLLRKSQRAVDLLPDDNCSFHVEKLQTLIAAEQNHTSGVNCGARDLSRDIWHCLRYPTIRM